MMKTTEELEAKLLAILNDQTELENLTDAVEQAVGEGEVTLSEDARATLASLLEAGLPSPQEIIRDALNDEHNARIRQARQDDLARRKERRAKSGKSRKNKKNRSK